ncbi:MAG: S-layer homology domain-containing protein, partial [Clostridia bacterium]|nr:S-layer homology domain-containing protein [Clostridia bacterium]
MRKTNKFVSLLLVLGLLCSVFVPTVAADTLKFSDVTSDNTYYEAITNLTAEGIINGFEDGTFKPDEAVTRAQYTKIMCYAQNVGDIKYSEADRAKFPDVDPNHWAIDNITTARNSGIINGYDDGTFKPENSVLYEQAVKMAVCALGYTEAHAIRAGGSMGAYPYGYINLATKAKLLNKISGVKMGEPLTRGRVAQLIDNMLNADTFDAETGGTGGSMKDETSTRVTVEGRISAIYGASIYHNETSPCNRKQIEIERPNGARELIGIENLSLGNLNDYLGRSVKVFYEEDRNADYQEANNIVVQGKEWLIPIGDVEGFVSGNLEYMPKNGSDTDTVSVASGVIVIVNGQAMDVPFNAALTSAMSESGYLTLICSQSKDIADIAIFKTYDTIFVNSQKDSTNHKIFNFNNPSNFYVLDESDRSKTITITKDGKPSKFADIPYTCLASVSTSQNGKYIDVQISTKTVSGKIDEVLGDGSIKLNTGANAVYARSVDCTGVGTFAAGSTVLLYIDAFGEIGRYNVTAEKVYTYGYLSSLETGTLTDPYVQVKIYNSSASNSTPTGKIYSLKKDVKIDGTTYSVETNTIGIKTKLSGTASKAGINTTINTTVPANMTYAQPIRYTTDMYGEIDSILTSDSTVTNHDLALNVAGTTLLTCRADGSILGTYSVSGSSVMLVPVDRTGGAYMTKSASSYFKSGESYYVQIVNAPTHTNAPAAIYVYGTSAGAGTTTAVISEDNVPMVVTKVIPESSYMGETRKQLIVTNTKTGET